MPNTLTTQTVTVATRRRVPLVRIERPVGHGPRLYIKGLRLHHGLVCAVGATVGVVCKQRALTLVALAGVVDDLKDWPWPLHDREPSTPVAVAVA